MSKKSQFMQRAAASNPPTSPESNLQSPSNPPSKRQKTSNTPSSISNAPTETQLMQAALDSEEQKRERAIEKLAEEAGETKWFLGTADGSEPKEGANGALRVMTAGYSDLDQDEWTSAKVGRKIFGKLKRVQEVSLDLVESVSLDR